MVSRVTLRYLSSQRLRDAKALFIKGRNGAAIYLMGYSLEYALKNRVIRTLGFTKGFPETSADFTLYTAQIAQFNSVNTGAILICPG